VSGHPNKAALYAEVQGYLDDPDSVVAPSTDLLQFIDDNGLARPTWGKGLAGGSLMGGNFLKDLVNKAVDFVKNNPQKALDAAKSVAGFVNQHKSKAADLYNKYVKGKKDMTGGILDGMTPREAKDHLRQILTTRALLKAGGL
jgi:hypothetical protein